MRKVFTLLFLLCSLVKLSAQLAEGTPCTAFCLDPNKSAIIGRMPKANGISPNLNRPCGGTASEDNPSWWVMRPSGNQLTFTLTTSSCFAGGSCTPGVSLTLFEGNSCGDVTAVNCIEGKEGVLSASVSPCKLYYLQLDGNCETVCDVNISYDKNQILTEVAAPSVNGPLQICKGAATTYSASMPGMEGCRPDGWAWSLTPSNAGTISQIQGSEAVKVRITDPPLNGKVELCVKPVFNGKCPPKTNLGCIELTIPDDNIISETCNIELCPRQLPYQLKLSDCLKISDVVPSVVKIDLPAGNGSTETFKYTVMNTECTGVVDLNILVREKSDQYFKQLPALLLCSGETRTVKGKTFSCADATGSPVLFLENEGTGSPVCDTVYELVVQCIDIVTEITGKAVLDCNNNPITLDISGFGSYISPGNIKANNYIGNGNQFIQWTKDGLDIPGATNNKLEAGVAGYYGVKVKYAYTVNQNISGKVSTQSKTCANSTFFMVNSSPSAAVAETPVAMTNVCEGGTAVYSIKPDPNAQSYKWTVNGTAQILGSETDPKNLVVKNNGTPYEVCLSKRACGKISIPNCISIKPVGKNLKPEIAGLYECEGDSSILHIGNRSNYSHTAHFNWMVENGAIRSWNLDSTSVKIFWNKGGKNKKVKLIASDICGKDTTSVDINTTLPATIKSNSPICTGLFLQLEAEGGVYYNWEGPDGFTSDTKTVKIGSMTAMQAGTYTVTASTSNGCSTTLSTIVKVEDLPSSAVSNSPVCLGNKLQLSASGGTQYRWEGPNGFSSSLQNPELSNFSDIKKGTYTVTISDASGCSSIKEVATAVATAPVVTVSNNSPICAGNTLRLSANGGTQYRWEGPNGFSSTLQNPEISNTLKLNSGSYVVTVTNKSGCTAVSQTAVTVNDGSSINAMIKSNSPVCSGDSIKLTASGGLIYSWSGPNGFKSTQTSVVIPNAQKMQEGTYMVTVTGANTCTVSVQTVVAINAQPQVSATCNSPVCAGLDATLTAQGGTNFSWSGPDNFKSTQQNPVISKVETKNAGTYTVTVTDSNNCKKAASTILEVKNCISTKDANGSNGITVFPNPASDRVTIQSVTGIVKVELFNAAGQKVLEKSTKGNEVILEIPEISPGEHLLKVFTDKTDFGTFKILIRR